LINLMPYQDVTPTFLLNITAIQTVENPTMRLPTFGSRKVTIDGYSTILAVCL